MKDFNSNHAFNAGYSSSILPQQALPSSKKTKKWIQATADALEVEGMRQLKENLKYVDYFRSVEGDLTSIEIKDMIPQLQAIGKAMEAQGVPSFLKNYDLLGTIVKTFIGWMTSQEDKYFVIGLDDYEMNEYIYSKTFLLHNSLTQQWDLLLNQRLIQMGLDPNLRDFSSDEEAKAYIDNINQAKASITPPEIQQWMDADWRSTGVRWGNATLESDKLRFNMNELDSECCKNMFITGKWFRNMMVGFDYYQPENWSPIETFYEHVPGLKYPQYGNYAGRITFMSPSTFISRYGQYIKAKDKQKLIGGNENWEGSWPVGGEKENFKSRKPSLLNWYGEKTVPFQGYDDYMSIKSLENYTGNPFGEYHYFDENGNEKVVPRFLPDMMFNPSGQSNYRGYADYIYGDPLMSRDLLQVMEAYFLSWKKIYLVNYESESGLVLQQIVTDDILPEFLKENGLKKRDLTMVDAMDDPEINTYTVEYVPEVRRVIKASGSAFLEDPLYLDGEPIEYQIKGDGNMYDFQLPVTGFIGPSPVERAMPWQALWNVSINKLRNLEEKEIGKLALFDVTLIPAEFSQWGDTEKSFDALMTIAKTTGLLGTDMSRNNTAQAGGTPFNQFAQYDLTQTSSMVQCINNAMVARSMCLEMFGITPQVLGTPQNYVTAEGVKQGMNATMVQVQEYFNNMDWSKKRALNTHLAVAQMCKKNGKDQMFLYTGSDLIKKYVELSDTEDIPLRHLGVLAVSDSATRKKIEGLKSALMQMNIAGNDVLSWAKLYTSESIQEVMAAGVEARRHQDEVRQQEYAQQQQLEQMRKQAMDEEREDNQQHEIEKEQVKGEYSLGRERIKAAGIAAGKDSDAQSLQFVQQQSKIALDTARQESDRAYKESMIESQNARDKNAADLRSRELDIKEEQNRLKEKEIENNRFTSVINKN